MDLLHVKPLKKRQKRRLLRLGVATARRITSVGITIAAMLVIRFVPEQQIADLGCDYGVESLSRIVDLVEETATNYLVDGSRMAGLVRAQMCEVDPPLVWVTENRTESRFGVGSMGLEPAEPDWVRGWPYASSIDPASFSGRPPLHVVLWRAMKMMSLDMIGWAAETSNGTHTQYVFYGVRRRKPGDEARGAANDEAYDEAYDGSRDKPVLVLMDRNSPVDPATGRWLQTEQLFDPDTGEISASFLHEPYLFWPADRPWYQGAKAQGPSGSLWTEPYTFVGNGAKGITYATSVPEGCKGSLTGQKSAVIFVDFDLALLSYGLSMARTSLAEQADATLRQFSSANLAAGSSLSSSSLSSSSSSYSSPTGDQYRSMEVHVIQPDTNDVLASTTATGSTREVAAITTDTILADTTAANVTNDDASLRAAKDMCKKRELDYIYLSRTNVDRPVMLATGNGAYSPAPGSRGWTLVVQVPQNFMHEHMDQWGSDFVILVVLFIPILLIIKIALYVANICAGGQVGKRGQVFFTAASGITVGVLLILVYMGQNGASQRQLIRIYDTKSLTELSRARGKLDRAASGAMSKLASILTWHQEALGLAPLTTFGDGSGNGDALAAAAPESFTESNGFSSWVRDADNDLKQLHDITRFSLKLVNTFPNSSFAAAAATTTTTTTAAAATAAAVVADDDPGGVLSQSQIDQAIIWFRTRPTSEPPPTASNNQSLSSSSSSTTTAAAAAAAITAASSMKLPQFSQVAWDISQAQINEDRSFTTNDVPGGFSRATEYWLDGERWLLRSGLANTTAITATPAATATTSSASTTTSSSATTDATRTYTAAVSLLAAETVERTPGWLSQALSLPLDTSQLPVVESVAMVTGAVWRLRCDLTGVQEALFGERSGGTGGEGAGTGGSSSSSVGTSAADRASAGTASVLLQADGAILAANRDVGSSYLEQLASVEQSDDEFLSRIYPEITARYPDMDPADTRAVWARVYSDLVSSWSRIRVGLSVTALSYIDMFTSEAVGACQGSGCPWLLMEAVQGHERMEYNAFLRLDVFTILMMIWAIFFAVYLDYILIGSKAKEEQDEAEEDADSDSDSNDDEDENDSNNGGSNSGINDGGARSSKGSTAAAAAAAAGARKAATSDSSSRSLARSISSRRVPSSKKRLQGKKSTRSLSHATAEANMQRAATALKQAAKVANENTIKLKMEIAL